MFLPFLPPGISRFRRFSKKKNIVFFTVSKSGVPPKTEMFPLCLRMSHAFCLVLIKKWQKRKGRLKIGVLDLNSIETESATMGADCEPAATRGAVRPRAPRSALGTTRMTLLLAATASMGWKPAASARSPTTPFTATERKTWLLQPPAGDQLLPGTPGSRS